MTKAVTASYHLPTQVKNYIDTESKNLNLNKGVFLAFLIENYQKLKSENKNLKAYFSIATDKDFLAEQIAESELDLNVELSINPDYAA